MADPNKGSLTGLTDEEAREFHTFYIQGAVGFTAVAVIAHFLVWSWRPWIPGPNGYSSLNDAATQVAGVLQSFIG